MSGLRVWDSASNLVFDTTGMLGLVLGRLSTGTATGSYTDPNLALGSPWAVVIPKSSLSVNAVPSVSFSGNTLTWTWPSDMGTQYRYDCYLTYGVR